MRNVKKLVFLGTFLFVLTANLQSATQLRPALIEVQVATPEATKGLLALGLDIIQSKPGEYLRILVSDQEMARISGAGYIYKVIYSDMIAHTQAALGKLDMGGYHTMDEIYAAMDSIHAEHPDITTAKDSIGHTIYGRPIYAMKISKNPGVHEDEPEIFFNSLIHAREPMGMETVLSFMRYLTNNYGSDPRVDSIVDNREIWFVPLVNPDGYEFNYENYPDGGGMWRKNLRYNGGGSYGVDLNRNYGYKWGFDDLGSSGYPGSEVYRGTGSFSEPETQAIRDFVLAHDFVVCVNYHSYADDFLYPWGYTPFQPPDTLYFARLADTATSVNHYLWGPGYSTIYPTNGDADDWMYGDQIDKKKCLSFTPEVGSYQQGGFWPPSYLIPTITGENLEANLLLSELAGPLYRRSFRSLSAGPNFINVVLNYGDSLLVPLKLYNRSNADSLYFQAKTSESPNWMVAQPESVTTGIAPLDSFQVTVKMSPQGLTLNSTHLARILLASHNQFSSPLRDSTYIPVQIKVLCSGLQMPGDANASGNYSLADIIAMVNYIFNKSGYPACGSNDALCWLSGLLCRGDWNGNGTVTLGDVIGGVNYLFSKPGGPWNPVNSGSCCKP